MLRLTLFLTAAALLLVAGCIAPLGGYYGDYGGYGGYGGYNYYGGYPSYPGQLSYGYPYPAPLYGYSGGYAGDDGMVFYPPEPVAINPPIDYQVPVYPPGTDPTVSGPQPPHWGWQASRQLDYPRRHRYHNHQGDPFNPPPETEHSFIPGADPPNGSVAGPHRRQWLGGDPRANHHQRLQSPRHQDSQRVQRAHPPSFPFGQPQHMADQQHRMRAPMARSTMPPPMARPNPTPSLRGPRPGGNPPRQASTHAPQAQNRQSRQKRPGQGSQ